MEASERGELEAIHEDLTAIRGCLMRSGLADAREMADRLGSVVSRFRHWTESCVVDRGSVEDIQRQLADLQPLFENAYALHSGWLGILDPECGQYDGGGRQVDASAGILAADPGHSVRG